MNRRKFLEKLGLVGAAVVAAPIVGAAIAEEPAIGVKAEEFELEMDKPWLGPGLYAQMESNRKFVIYTDHRGQKKFQEAIEAEAAVYEKLTQKKLEKIIGDLNMSKSKYHR